MIDTAIILVGGLGTRLRPLTDTTPKPLLPVQGKPMVQHIIENLRDHGVKKIILSIGYKAELIQQYFADGAEFGVQISYSLETEPLGTGGAVRQAARELTEPFFLLWGDNLMRINLTEMYNTYKQNSSSIIMTLTPREDVENFGVAKLEKNKIIFFVEKPKREEAPSNLINAGAFIIDPQHLKMLPEGKSSIERDCFEKLAPQGEISYYIHQEKWFPTDTLEKYSLACKEFEAKINFAAKKVIITDVDETVCYSCQPLSKEMSEQIQKLMQKDYIFVFISGTDTQNLHTMISSQLKGEHHLLGNSGTCYDLIDKDGKINKIYNEIISEIERGEIIAAFEKLIETFNIISLTTKKDQILDRGSQITLSAIGRNAPLNVKEKFDPDGSKRKTWVEFLKQDIDGTKYDLKIGGTTSIDITLKGRDKGWGVRQFAKHHTTPFSGIVFFGDKIYPGGNDYPVSNLVDCVSVKNPQEMLEKLKRL